MALKKTSAARKGSPKKAGNKTSASLRKRNAVLLESPAMLDVVQRVAGIGIWEWDLEQRQSKCSEGFMRLYGREGDGQPVTFEKWIGWVHPTDHMRVEQELNDAMSGRKSLDMLFRTVWPNGSVHWLHSRAFAETRDEAGRCTRMIGLNIDVTERVRLEQALVRRAEEERLRLASEMHDNLGQQLAALKLLASDLAERLRAEGSPQAEAAMQLSEHAAESQRMARDLTRGLMPVELDAAGLMSALRDLARSTRQLHGVACEFTCDQPVHVKDNFTATHLYYIAREAVTNAVRHGRPKRIGITLQQDPVIRLEVCDDGRGFAGDAGRQAGQGIGIMHHRAALIGAALHLETAPGRGCQARCILAPGITKG